MSKRRNRAGLTLSIGCIAVICLGACLLFAGYLEVTRRVEAAYGSPSSKLDPLQRLRLSAQLLMLGELLQQPTNAIGDSETFEIPLGQSPLIIAAQLEAFGLISNAGAFIDYLVEALCYTPTFDDS